MKTHIFAASAFAAIAIADSVAANPAWQPSDFESAYVQIIDNATNGCWTNIGEVRSYAEDQLELAGFKVIEPPEFRPDLPYPVLRENITEYRLHVKASREDNGVCIGYLNSSFWGAVAPGYNPRILIVGQIGVPYVWAVWNTKNLNKYMFDQVKDTIEAWVDLGVQSSKPE